MCKLCTDLDHMFLVFILLQHQSGQFNVGCRVHVTVRWNILGSWCFVTEYDQTSYLPLVTAQLAIDGNLTQLCANLHNMHSRIHAKQTSPVLVLYDISGLEGVVTALQGRTIASVGGRRLTYHCWPSLHPPPRPHFAPIRGVARIFEMGGQSI